MDEKQRIQAKQDKEALAQAVKIIQEEKAELFDIGVQELLDRKLEGQEKRFEVKSSVKEVLIGNDAVNSGSTIASFIENTLGYVFCLLEYTLQEEKTADKKEELEAIPTSLRMFFIYTKADIEKSSEYYEDALDAIFFQEDLLEFRKQKETKKMEDETKKIEIEAQQHASKMRENFSKQLKEKAKKIQNKIERIKDEKNPNIEKLLRELAIINDANLALQKKGLITTDLITAVIKIKELRKNLESSEVKRNTGMFGGLNSKFSSKTTSAILNELEKELSKFLSPQDKAAIKQAEKQNKNIIPAAEKSMSFRRRPSSS